MRVHRESDIPAAFCQASIVRAVDVGVDSRGGEIATQPTEVESMGIPLLREIGFRGKSALWFQALEWLMRPLADAIRAKALDVLRIHAIYWQSRHGGTVRAERFAGTWAPVQGSDACLGVPSSG